MRRTMAAAAVCGLLAAGISASRVHALEAGTAVCRSDGEVDAAERKSAGATALALLQALISGDVQKSDAMFTEGVREHTTPEQRAAFVRVVASLAPLSNPRVEHVYAVDDSGDAPGARAICGQVSGDDWVSVTAAPGKHVTYVALAVSGRNNDFAVTVRLIRTANGGWGVTGYYVSPETIVGDDAEEMLGKYRSERNAGRGFNAAMLLAGAKYLSNRGAGMALGVSQRIASEMASFQPPPELRGPPPFTWHMGGKAYVVNQVSILGIGKELGLVFVLPHRDWPESKIVDADNRQFLDAFRATHPEYAKTFGFLAAQAMKPDNSGGFRTIYENGSGYAR